VFGTTDSGRATLLTNVPGFPRPFSTEDADEETFDEYDEFRPDHLPESGPFLDGADVLTGEDHAEFHRLTRDIFEERGVYDATFGYNLARLNLDSRHPDAGWRYARAPVGDESDVGDDVREADDSSVLLAEFTPTTEFCPQSESLTVGAFRAWNGLDDRHDYDCVLVAVSPMHYESTNINEKLRKLEERLGNVEEDTEVVEKNENVSKRMKDVFNDEDESSLPF
jgi:hypothetical protein